MNYLVHFLMSEWMEMSVPLVYTVNYWEYKFNIYKMQNYC